MLLLRSAVGICICCNILWPDFTPQPSCITKCKIFDNNMETFRIGLSCQWFTVHRKHIIFLYSFYFHLGIHFDTFRLRLSSYFNIRVIFFSCSTCMKGYGIRSDLMCCNCHRKVCIGKKIFFNEFYELLSSTSRANKFLLPL